MMSTVAEAVAKAMAKAMAKEVAKKFTSDLTPSSPAISINLALTVMRRRNQHLLVPSFCRHKRYRSCPEDALLSP